MDTSDDSDRLADIIGQELVRVGRAALPGSEDESDRATMLAMKRVAMRSFHAGQVTLAAQLTPSGVHVHLDTTLIDEEGVDLLLPPLGD